MNHLGYTLFIALSNNVDNITARIAYSIKGIHISIPINIYISVITFVISSLAAYSGTTISGILSKRAASVIAMILLTAIGLWMILDQFIKRDSKNGAGSAENPKSRDKAGIMQVMNQPEKADMDESMHIDFKEATILGVALSINNIGGGLSAGMIGINAITMGLLSAVINFLALWAGNYIAEFFIKWNLHRKAAFAAGLILIGIGIEQII